ncbi:hypothetical protein TcWFU_002894 [Taenia crassiceps]|uniref:Uncharacterized protein n=1 Tax=Taenia crassiceps TaxID=6207 RepID=A0ABR4Q357_9CEST
MEHKRRLSESGRDQRIDAAAVVWLAVRVTSMRTIGVPAILGLENTDEIGMDLSEGREGRLERLQRLLSYDDDSGDEEEGDNADGEVGAAQ